MYVCNNLCVYVDLQMDEQNSEGMPSRRAVWSVQYWAVVRGATHESLQGIVTPYTLCSIKTKKAALTYGSNFVRF